MARRSATAAEAQTALLGCGTFGLGVEIVGLTLDDGPRLSLATLGMMLTVGAAIEYGRLWALVRARTARERR